MPKKTSHEDILEILEKIDWVRRLPETAWSRGIIDTAESVAVELDDLEREKAVIVEKFRSRLRVMKLIPARVRRESKLMYDADDIAEAQKGLPSTESDEYVVGA